MLTIDRREEASDGGLVLALTFGDLGPDAGTPPVRAALHSRPGEVALTFGPSRHVDHWPALVCRHAVYGADGASLTLRLDPGEAGPPLPGRLSACTAGGRGERQTLSAILTALSVHLGADTASDGDLRLRQATDVVVSLAHRIRDSWRFIGPLPDEPPPAAKPDLFAPSVWSGAEVDDVRVSDAWSHLRLGYELPRLNGIWTRRVTWRVFHAGRRFGLEFRALGGDHPPIGLVESADTDEHGPVLRAEMDLNDPFAVSPAMVRLRPDQRAMVVAIARQTALDLPQVLDRHRDPPPFSRARWRHWSRLLPDVLAGMPVDA